MPATTVEKPGLTPADLVASTTKLYSLPDIYFRVQSIVDDPNSSMADLAKVIGTDPGITARLLRLANSAYFGMAMRIDTVHKAINMLGMLQVHDLVLATSVVQTFSGISSTVMNMEKFWYQSVHCGVVARMLATACNVIDNERLFVAGLLHDIGHLLMYQHIPSLARTARQAADEKDVALFRVERALIGFDYAQAGAAMMQSWKFPAGLQEATLCHPEPATASEFPLEAAIVHIAAQISAAMGNGKSLENVVIDPHAWQVTGRAPEDLEPIVRAAEAQTAQVISLIQPGQRRSA